MNIMRDFRRIRLITFVYVAGLIGANTGMTMPVGFQHRSYGKEYNELITNDFHIYFDKRTPSEAKATLNSLIKAKPILEKWLQVKRDRPLPVIMTPNSNNPSFANFVYDAIELQTMGRGDRDL
ncbi:MAG: hypothetical protein CMP10_13050, partial [Zetaproteobacteria bacterium]|nr:hypothetical protein [Pseudobdellovibrionaceae bacterium]